MIYFITAIGTDSGKTLVSAIFSEALGADYWKPIQSGKPKDSDTIKDLVSKDIKIHKEAYLFKTPASPHAAAKIDGVKIELKKINIPKYNQHLIIEGAGGLLVPINDDEKIADLILKLKVPIVLVVNLYLGCINHSLLTIEALKARNIFIWGIVFNGDANVESEQQILKHAEAACLLRINREAVIDKETVKKYSISLLTNLDKMDSGIL